MQYFKNIELAKLYPVSESAVRKWIDSTRQGKLNLQLYEHNGKFHIANTSKNVRLIEELVARGQKYKNTRGHKVVSPTSAFYELYTKEQAIDIINNLEIHRELPLQYSYFDGGVDYWNSYAERLWKEDGENTLNASISLLQSNFSSIDDLLKDYDRVNIIDIGVGNGLPVKELLAHLLYERGILARYIGIDISKGMIEVVKKNVDSWFQGRVNFEGYVRDITYERFDDLLIDEDPRSTANLVLVLGGTLNNLRSPDDALRTIHSSMGRNDLVAIATKLDSEEARRYFDFNTDQHLPKLAKNHRLILELLNIDESFYEVEQAYDEVKQARFIRVRFKVDVAINFEFKERTRRVDLHKGDSLLLWRAWHQNTLDIIKQFDRNGFALLQASTTKDRHYILAISEIARSSQLGA